MIFRNRECRYLSIYDSQAILPKPTVTFAEMKADIARERVILEHALDVGHPLEVAESMLHALEAALRIFEKHRELVLDQLKRRPSE